MRARCVLYSAVTLALVAAVTAQAFGDVLPNSWIRGASSVAVNDDATALFLNPAGLGLNSVSGTYAALTMSGDETAGFAAAFKTGPLGFGYDRQYLFSSSSGGPDDLSPSDRKVDTYYLGLAMGDMRSFSVGLDYRWFRPQFGDRDKTGTWDVGAVYRPSTLLSVGLAVRNLSEPDNPAAADAEDCECETRATYVAGIALRPTGNRMTLMADASQDRDQEMSDAIYTAGIEAEPIDGLILRGSIRSFPSGDDRELEYSAGVWFNTTHTGAGAWYRELKEAKNPIIGYGLTTSQERQRSVLHASNGIAEVKVEGPLADVRPGWSLFGEPKRSAQSVIGDLRKAAEDPSVDCILLNVKSLGQSFLGGPSALVQEVRDEVVRVKRDHGVKVLAFLEYGAGTSEYYLATASDHIVMHPVSGIDGIGNYVNVDRFTGTSEKIGIQWDYLTAGKYKSTFHSIGAGPLSDAQREEVQSLTDNIYANTVRAVAEGRGMSDSRARELCDGRMYLSDDAAENGLIDEVGTYDDAKAAATKLAGGTAPEQAEDIATLDVSDWVKLRYDWGDEPVVAVIGAYGDIHEGKGGTDVLRGNQSIGSETLVEALRSARKNPQVKAVVLRIDSGGGSGLASDIIWYETVKLAKEKPLIVSMADMAASGGYYIAVEGEKIFADPLTITGSIGVVGMKPVFAELFHKIDATSETFKSAEYADQFSTMRNATPEERQMAQDVIDSFYDDFTDKVAEARDMPVERVRELAQGKVYMGDQAAEVDLVDELGGLSDAIDYACSKIGTDREHARIIYYREGRTFMEEFLGNVSAKLGLWKLFNLGGSGMSDLTTLDAFVGNAFTQ